MATGINKMYDIDKDDFKQLQSLFISFVHFIYCYLSG